MHILLVEGNTDAAQTLSLLLKLMGHDVRVAHTGPEGLDAVREQPPDAVFAAISLPGAMDGYELARQLQPHPNRGKMLVAALTGFGTPDDRRRCLEAGFDLHLVKPVDVAELERVLAAHRDAQR
jgi:CheY-like chemotaxis protein